MRKAGLHIAQWPRARSHSSRSLRSPLAASRQPERRAPIRSGSRVPCRASIEWAGDAQHHVAAPALTRGGQERGLTGERPTVLLAHGPGRGQLPVDEVPALVVVGAAARVEQGGVSVPFHGGRWRRPPAEVASLAVFVEGAWSRSLWRIASSVARHRRGHRRPRTTRGGCRGNLSPTPRRPPHCDIGGVLKCRAVPAQVSSMQAPSPRARTDAAEAWLRHKPAVRRTFSPVHAHPV